MDCCLIVDPDDGVRTDLSANTALFNQNRSIVPFMNQSFTNLSYGAVSGSLVWFINSH